MRVEIPEIDIRGLNESSREEKLQALIVEESGNPFDLSSSPLFRVKAVRINDSEWVLLFTLHHIISDGWSTGVMINEIARLYPAIKGGQIDVDGLLPELPVQYMDYAAWQREMLPGNNINNELDFCTRNYSLALAQIKPVCMKSSNS